MKFGVFKGEWITECPLGYLENLYDDVADYWSKQEIELLDLAIYIKQDGVDIRRYIKRNGRPL